jgi:hypothetical protein
LWAKLLTRDAARRIAANIAKLSELPPPWSYSAGFASITLASPPTSFAAGSPGSLKSMT